MINISLTTEEAELFKDFRKYQDVFTALRQACVFTTKNGSVTMDFDHQGILQQIKSNVLLYKRKSFMV